MDLPPSMVIDFNSNRQKLVFIFNILHKKNIKQPSKDCMNISMLKS